MNTLEPTPGTYFAAARANRATAAHLRHYRGHAYVATFIRWAEEQEREALRLAFIAARRGR